MITFNEFLEERKTNWIQKAIEKPGSFTDYCGGKVTDDCIEKGKNSPNSKTRKRANLADNLRKMR